MTTDRRSLPVYAAGAIDVPYTIDGFDERVEHDTHWSEHSHPTHELLWNERGISRATTASRSWTITPVLGLWMPAGVIHSASATAGTWYRTAHFSVTVESISERPVGVEVTPLLKLLLQRLVAPGLLPRSRELTEALILDVLEPSPRELFVHIPDSPLLAPIVEAVQQRPGEARALSQWAQQLDVSTRTITRAFRAETGVGFVQWVATVRAQRAIPLLARGDDLEDVAAELGYHSTSAFAAAFRRTTGFTPSTFRPSR
ncbi:helix-turn-helix transcriptional regulator [Compostimonas suwonensis]|nr:AraC family transcriptional regulator [Compostimonas suwonensis]